MATRTERLGVKCENLVSKRSDVGGHMSPCAGFYLPRRGLATFGHIPFMRPRHTQHSLPGFPIYSAAFIAPDRIVVGGGGGSSKSGIENKLV